MQTALLTGSCQGSVWVLADLNGSSEEPSTDLYLYNTALAGSFDNSLIFFKSYLLLPGQGTEERQLLSLLGCRGVAAGVSYHFCYTAVLLVGDARLPREQECWNVKAAELQN